MFGRGRGAPPAESHTHTHTEAVQMWSDTRQPFLSRYDERLQQEAAAWAENSLTVPFTAKSKGSLSPTCSSE